MGRSKVRLKWNGGEGLAELVTHEALLPVVKEKVEAIAAACNAESAWGGYASAASIDGDRVRGRVWSFDDRNDEARDNRMVKHLDAGA